MNLGARKSILKMLLILLRLGILRKLQGPRSRTGSGGNAGLFSYSGPLRRVNRLLRMPPGPYQASLGLIPGEGSSPGFDIA